MSLVDIKAAARRAIHQSLGVPATLVDADHPNGLVFAAGYGGPFLTVRYWNKQVKTGALNADYAQVIEGINQLCFLDDNIAAVSTALVANGQPPLVLERNALVTIPGYSMVFSLDTDEPTDGPAETVWTVARMES